MYGCNVYVRCCYSISVLHVVPSKPTRVRGFCSIVVWGEPSEPNGKIVGYDLNFYVPDNPLLRNIVYGVATTLHDVKKSTDLPNADSAVLYVQVFINVIISNIMWVHI